MYTIERVTHIPLLSHPLSCMIFWKPNEVVCHKRLKEWQHKLGWQEHSPRWVRLRVTQLGYTRTRATTTTRILSLPPPPLESLPLPPPWKCDRVHGAMHSYSLPPSYINVVPLCLLFASIRFPIPVTITHLLALPLTPHIPCLSSLLFSKCRHLSRFIVYFTCPPPLLTFYLLAFLVVKSNPRVSC